MSRRPALACHERMEQLGVRALADVELLTILLGPTAGMNSTRDAAQRILDALRLAQLAWASADELQQHRASAPRAPPRSPPPSSSGAGEPGRRRSEASACSIPGASTS